MYLEKGLLPALERQARVNSPMPLALAAIFQYIVCSVPTELTSVSDAKRLKELETENGRLKKLLAESQLEIGLYPGFPTNEMP